jgi:AAHS family 3-hydroxyphenylpropionic acid transporter
MYCGVPIGAALAAALGFSGLAAAWQTIFWIGGVVPLLLIPLLMRWLPESQAFQRAEASVPLRTLFARARPPPRCCCGWAIFHPAGGLYADQLAADAAGGPGIPRQPGGGGDVLSADRRRLRHAAAGGANG